MGKEKEQREEDNKKNDGEIERKKKMSLSEFQNMTLTFKLLDNRTKKTSHTHCCMLSRQMGEKKAFRS